MKKPHKLLLAVLFGLFLLIWPAYLFGNLHNPFSSQPTTATPPTAPPDDDDWFGKSYDSPSPPSKPTSTQPPPATQPNPARQFKSPAPIKPHSPPRHVTVINCVPYHTEVLVGLVDLVKLTGHQLVVYAHLRDSEAGQNVAAGLALLKQKHGDFTTQSCDALIDKSHAPAATGLTLYASAAEDAYGHREAFIASLFRLKPKRIATVIHNTGLAEVIQSIMTCHPQVFLMGLAKRNYQSLFRTTSILATRLTRPPPSCGWFVPFHALPPADACLQPSAPCHAHFTVQGNLEPHRRNYPALFEDLAGSQAALAKAGVQVKLVGAGQRQVVEELVPKHLAGVVTVHANYNYSSFYSELQASIALVPLLGSPQYLDGTRITSTLLSALITGVPILADAAFLDAYSFIPAPSFYLQLPGESLSQAMLRVAAMSAEEHAAVRGSLRAAAGALLRHNADMLLQVLRGV